MKLRKPDGKDALIAARARLRSNPGKGRALTKICQKDLAPKLLPDSESVCHRQTRRFIVTVLAQPGASETLHLPVLQKGMDFQVSPLKKHVQDVQSDDATQQGVQG